ncbi:MAG: uroporphyrinogen decarboxylase family protein [Armatimonadota bacterium]
MTSPQRVRRAIEFASPDRIPVIHAVLPGGLIRHREALLDVFRRYPSDFGPPEHEIPESAHFGMEGYHKEYVDDWGVTWAERYEGIMGIPTRHPLADWRALDNYQPPRPPACSGEQFDNDRAATAERKRQYYTMAGAGTLYERLQQLRGYESLVYDLVEDRPELHRLADLVVEYNLAWVQRGVKLGAHGIGFADDWGTQRQLAISPDLWRRFFKPRYERMFRAAKAGGCHVHFHSDGHIMEIVDDLMEIGVDCLNPQFSCMDLPALAQRVRGRLCLLTDLDRQHILPFGTPAQVKQHVREIVALFATPAGGLIGRGEIGPDVPLENVEAMFEAFAEHGVVAEAASG